MKCKGLYVLATVAMLASVAGCGSNPGDEKLQNQATEAVMPTKEPVATATPEPTATPAPTVTPVPKNYMERNKIRVVGAGDQEYQGFICEEYDEEGNPILEIGTCESIFEVTEEDNGDGTKTISATIHVIPYVFENGWSSYAMSGFVDLQTGKSFFPYDDSYAQTTYLRRDDKNYEITLTCEMEYVSATSPYNTARYTLVCPSDYEDAAFYLTGYNGNWETFIERAGNWILLNFIKHGTSETIVFGVNEGLATMPTGALQERIVRGVAQSAEHYFETNDLTTQGEGKTTYRGTEYTYEGKLEDFYEDDVVIETKDVEMEFRKTEELLDDGRKQIRGSFTGPADIATEEFSKGLACLAGVVDMKTGLSYCPRTIILGDPVVLDRGGEEIPMMITSEENITEDNILTITYVITCPQDYDDAAFYITGNYRNKELREKRVGHWLPISEVEHGDSDMVFFE